MEFEVPDCALGFNGLSQAITASVSSEIILLGMVVFICSIEMISIANAVWAGTSNDLLSC